ncbi:uncharacterized protein LOC119289489 [Triticum dicoccoides]|uniref:uncharacterized protein LOC119289489 n=1 Tax=Triticum dicoccoides TaxID=85692 RepID=UPI0018900162|nr:uncharacterized protein LOC119289489 [Triticum dicoccoides]
MAPTMLSLWVSCASTCAVFSCGAFSLARSPVRHVMLLLWLLSRRSRLFLLPTLLRLIGMQPRPLMMLRWMLMISRYPLTQMLFLFTGMICLLTLSGATMMLERLRFSLRVSYPSLRLSSWVLVLLLRCGPIFVTDISHLVMLSTYLWCVRSMLCSRVTLLLMSSTPRALPSGVSLTLSRLWFVVLAAVVRLCGQTWSFIVSTSSYLAFAQSLSLGVLTCLLVVVFLFRRCLPSFVLRRHISGLLICLWFPLFLLPKLLCCLLTSLLHRSCPHLQGGVSPSFRRGSVVLAHLLWLLQQARSPRIRLSQEAERPEALFI